MALFSKPTARALAILDLLTANPQEAFGLTDITRKLGLNKATCHAILTTMSHYGFLIQDPRSKAYRLGPNIVAAGNAAHALFPILEYARAELEAVSQTAGLGCGAAGRSGRNIVLLAHYGHSNPMHSPFQLGMRLPFMAPLGASFIAWSPAKQLESWLQSGEQQLADTIDDKLDQQLRISVIAIRARGFEVTLRTDAEETLNAELSRLRGTWDLAALDEVTSQYQRGLLQAHYHLDRIDPATRYPVCNITVPVFGYDQLPELIFSSGSFTRDLRGQEILDIAEQLKGAAERARQAASRAYNRPLR